MLCRRTSHRLSRLRTLANNAELMSLCCAARRPSRNQHPIRAHQAALHRTGRRNDCWATTRTSVDIAEEMPRRRPPNQAKSENNMTSIAPDRTVWPTLARSGPNQAKWWPLLGPKRAKSGQCWPKLCMILMRVRSGPRPNQVVGHSSPLRNAGPDPLV